MRGKAYMGNDIRETSGITPAYAGKSLEKRFKFKMTLGSPPPMRGKGSYVLVGVTIFGITPAYAGKSFITMSHSLLQEDHPRLCGEKVSSLVFCWEV